LTGTGASSSPDAVKLGSPAFKSNPFPFYAQLRAESPVHRVLLPTKEMAWLVTRYDDVMAVLKDDRFVKDTKNALTPEQAANLLWFRKMFKELSKNMLNQDPPNHTRLRSLVSKAFTPRLIEHIRDRIKGLADELIDRARPRGGMDLIHDYALPIPTTVIAEMLGVPIDDRHKFQRWSNAIMSAGSSTWGLVSAVPNAWAFIRYLRKFIKTRRADPGDDLVSALVRADEAGDTLSEDELLAMVMLLLVAGHETTVNLIGNGVLALLEHPEQLERLRKDPTLIKPAIEELLRYAGPVEMATERYAREDAIIAGTTIPRGDMVFVVIASANRDERQFPDPDKMDITRDPNRHLSFGLGTHFCLGAPLARLEGQIAIDTLLKRLPGLRLTVARGGRRWRRGLILRGLETLPVEFA
jgi:cytochrome P450 PksS